MAGKKEISLQQIQTGVQRDLPDALELGQLSLSTDVGRVFVGLPSSTHPASLVAGRNWTNEPNSGKENVEIITEFTPWSVINKLVNKPLKATIPAGGVANVKVQGTSRLFLEYVSYSSDTSNPLLESGAVQMVYNNSNVIIAQQNNTNDPEGLVKVDFSNPTYNVTTKQMQIQVHNSSTDEMIVEFITRGWEGL